MIINSTVSWSFVLSLTSLMITSMSTMIIATRNTATIKVATHSSLIPFFVEMGSLQPVPVELFTVGDGFQT